MSGQGSWRMMGRGERVVALGRVAGVSLLATAAGIGCSALGERRPPPLPAAVTGERRETDQRAGRLSYYVDGAGPPLLLIHSINAAGSAYEVRPIFEHERTQRRVFAVDLPGFGFSDRSPRNYNPKLYVDAIDDMLDVIAADCGPQPVDALALSLSSEFLARAAVAQPERFRTVALVTPTGFDEASARRQGRPGETREVPGLYAFFTFPLWSQGFYDLLVSKPSIRFFLKKTFGSKDIDEGLASYDYLTTHQPGAKNAPYAFVSGRLFSADSRAIYQELTMPVWLAYGTRGDFGDFSAVGWAKERANWTVEAYETGALPFFEKPEAFFQSYDRFLAEAPSPAGVYPSASDARSPSP